MTDEQALKRARDESIRRIMDACRATGDGRTGTRVEMGFEALYQEIGVLSDALDQAQMFGLEAQRERNALREELIELRAAVLREALDAVPQDICTHDGCDKETTCPLTRVNVAISALLSPEKAK